MKVMSLWTLRTSKIFCRPRPSSLSQVRFLSMSSQFSHSGPNCPMFHRRSMSRSSSMPSLYGLSRRALVAIVPEWWSA